MITTPQSVNIENLIERAALDKKGARVLDVEVIKEIERLLIRAFDFADTPQGARYWAGVVCNLRLLREMEISK